MVPDADQARALWQVASGHLIKEINDKRGNAMRRVTGACAAVAVAGMAAGMLGAAPAGASVNWAAKTCAAERAYVAHPSAGRLDAMMADSFRVAWKYVGEDAAGLYSDVRGGAKSAKYVASDERYMAGDCR